MELSVQALGGGRTDVGAERRGQLDAEQARNAVGGDTPPHGPGNKQLSEPAGPHGPPAGETPNGIVDAKAAGSPSTSAREQPSTRIEALTELDPGTQRLDGAAREGHGAARQTHLPPLEIDVGGA